MAITTTRAGTAATRPTRGRRRTRWLAHAGIALALCVVTISTGGRALAALHGEVLWLSAGQALRDGDVWTARKTSQRALERNPHNYRYLARAAAVEQALGRVRHARELWLEALAQRPGSPYPWAALARWELDHGSPAGIELQRSLTQSRHLGAQERALWRLFALATLRHWDDELPEEVRAPLKQIVQQEFERNWVQLGGYALLRRQEAPLCAIVGTQGQPGKWCEGTRQVRSICDRRDVLPRRQLQWCEAMDALWRRQAYPPE